MAPTLPNLKGRYLGAGWEPALMFLQQEDWADLPWHCQPWPWLDWKVVCQAPGEEGPLLTFLFLTRLFFLLSPSTLSPFPSLSSFCPPLPPPLLIIPSPSLSPQLPSPSSPPPCDLSLFQAAHTSHPQAPSPFLPSREAHCGERRLKGGQGPDSWGLNPNSCSYQAGYLNSLCIQVHI